LNIPLLISLREVSEQPDPATFIMPNNPIAVALEGTFQSVFRNRLTEKYTKGTEFDLKEERKQTKMIVVSDANIIKNDVRRRADGVFITPLGYDRYTKQTYGNKEFVMNAVHYLIDESGILNLRSREIKLRLLDKSKIVDQRVRWQVINTILPLLFIMLFAFLMAFLRKRKYTA